MLFYVSLVWFLVYLDGCAPCTLRWPFLAAARTEPQARAELIAVLEGAGPEGMKTGEIAEALGKSNNAVCNIIKILQDKGRVFSVSHGRYILSQFHESSLMKVSEYVNIG